MLVFSGKRCEHRFERSGNPTPFFFVFWAEDRMILRVTLCRPQQQSHFGPAQKLLLLSQQIFCEMKEDRLKIESSVLLAQPPNQLQFSTQGPTACLYTRGVHVGFVLHLHDFHHVQVDGFAVASDGLYCVHHMLHTKHNVPESGYIAQSEGNLACPMPRVGVGGER